MHTVDDELIAERAVRGGRRLTMQLVLDGERVPAVFLLPDTDTAVPGVLLLHGYGSRKEHMADAVGRELLVEGLASLAIDLPLHGERERSVELAALRNPLALLSEWRAAVSESVSALDWLAGRHEIARERLGLAGYSMGSFVGVAVSAKTSRVRALALAAGGDLPEGSPLERVVRTVADPIRAIRKLRGRPLLMVHGERDRTVTPAQARRLFAAAGEPKELRWYATGHWLPDAATRDAAGWLRERLSA